MCTAVKMSHPILCAVDQSEGHIFCIIHSITCPRPALQEAGVIHNLPRNATIVSRENVECLLVPPDVCKRVFPQEFESEYKYRLANMRYVGVM